MQIRNTAKDDYRAVEQITRKAFWNLHVPGCDEHYLAHMLRQHKDYIPELDFVAVKDGRIIGNIMYTSSCLKDGDRRLDTLTFGPVSVLPEFQKQGIGSRLITLSFDAAQRLGHKVVIIFGNPGYYCKLGFMGAKTMNVATPDGRFPCGLLVKELKAGVLAGGAWQFFGSEAYTPDREGFEAYDATFDPMEKAYQHTQELFAILSRAYRE